MGHYSGRRLGHNSIEIITATTTLPFAQMKIVSASKQPLAPSNSLVCLALVAGILVFAGCGKAKKSAPETPPPAPESARQAEPDHMPVYPPTQAGTPAVVAAPNGEPDLAELNRSLLRWMMSNRRRPSSFEDFAATAGVVIPTAPPGKKYVIAKNMHIELVKK